MLGKNQMFRLYIAIVYLTVIMIAGKAFAQGKTSFAEFDDSGWTILYQENFDTDYEAVNGQTFGSDSWLTYQLINDGVITVANGYAQLNAPDFWNTALIRSTDILPPEFRIRTKIGYINYDLTNYEQADYDDPDFNDHSGHYENGMYFLTLTDDTCSGNECAEEWWHFHRKMVIDVDNHINWGGGGETFHPVYMVYLAPETHSGGNYIRSWDGVAWDESYDNWNVAYTYEYDTWYYAEVEKINDSLILRLYDESRNIIEETAPVSLDKIFAMDDPVEYLYLGEPHTDDYEGDVRIDEITLLVPGDNGWVCGDASGDQDVNIGDVVFLVNYIFNFEPAPDPYESGDATCNGVVDIGDAVFLVNYIFRSISSPSPCDWCK
jgi:hypothetical protein